MKGNVPEPVTSSISTQDVAQKVYTLKILFGPLFGCELHLPADDYFLIIGSGRANDSIVDSLGTEQHHAASYTRNTLYIPCDRPSPNLVLNLSSPIHSIETGTHFQIDVQGELANQSVTLKENEIFSHAPICLAVKSSEVAWLESIAHFSLHHSSTPEQTTPFTKKSAVVTLCVLSLLLSLVIVVGRSTLMGNGNLLITELKQSLATAPTPLNILPGRMEPFVYILTRDYQTMQWLLQALIKFNDNASVVPIWLPQHNKAVIEQFVHDGYPVLQVDYTRPTTPIVAMWQALTPQQATRFSALALASMPFAREIATTVITKNQLRLEAQQGLERLQMTYRQVATSSGYAFVIQGEVNDTTYVALRDFITEFYHRWGNRIISFSINLNENGLAEKSYLNTTNGYYFLTPRHWVFPLNKEI